MFKYHKDITGDAFDCGDDHHTHMHTHNYSQSIPVMSHTPILMMAPNILTRILMSTSVNIRMSIRKGSFMKATRR